MPILEKTSNVGNGYETWRRDSLGGLKNGGIGPNLKQNRRVPKISIGRFSKKNRR